MTHGERRTAKVMLTLKQAQDKSDCFLGIAEVFLRNQGQTMIRGKRREGKKKKERKSVSVVKVKEATVPSARHHETTMWEKL